MTELRTVLLPPSKQLRLVLVPGFLIALDEVVHGHVQRFADNITVSSWPIGTRDCYVPRATPSALTRVGRCAGYSIHQHRFDPHCASAHALLHIFREHRPNRLTIS